MPSSFLSYPLRGVTPQQCSSGGEHFLHAVVQHAGGWPGAAFLESHHAIRKHPFPVDEYVRIPYSDGGSPHLDIIQFDRRAGLTGIHFATLHRLTEIYGVHWAVEAGGEVQLLDNPLQEHRIPIQDSAGTVVEEFRAPSFSIALAGLRVLALQSMISQN